MQRFETANIHNIFNVVLNLLNIFQQVILMEKCFIPCPTIWGDLQGGRYRPARMNIRSGGQNWHKMAVFGHLNNISKNYTANI